MTEQSYEARQNEVDQLHEFKQRLEKTVGNINGPITIVTHMLPDMDCIGAAIGLRDMLQLKYPTKEFRAVIPDIPITRRTTKFESYAHKHNVEWANGKPAERVADNGMAILVDTNEWRRAGMGSSEVENIKRHNVPLVILDHHKGEVDHNSFSYIDTGASSACEIVAQLYGDEPLMKPSTARALAHGIISDTGKLHFLRPENYHSATEALGKVFRKAQVANLGTLIKEAVPPLNSEEVVLKTQLESTRTTFELDSFTDTIAMCFEQKNVDPMVVDEDLVATEVLDEFLEDGADFAAFIKRVPVTEENISLLREKNYDGQVGDSIWEFKLRTHTIPIAQAIGEVWHRGGHSRAAKAEYWPTSNERARFRNGELDEEDMLGSAVKEFLDLYNDLRQRI
jgi:hypothetical protein